MNYIIEKNSIRNFSDSYSLSARDYREHDCKNTNKVKLKNLLKVKHRVGKEIGSANYIKKSRYRFLKTVNITNDLLINEDTIEYSKPIKNTHPKKNNILIVKDGGGNGLGEVCLYPYENEDNLDSLSAGIIAVDVYDDKRYYVFALLKSKHFKSYIDLNTPQGSTIRHSKLIALDYCVPFPTTINNSNPKDVEKLVSFIVKNIIDKERQINAKNKLIDELIEKELSENQIKNDLYYSYPKISEIKNKGRLDTGLYEKEFKNNEFLLKNYKYGCFSLADKGYIISRGQNLQISNIGRSYYSKIKLTDKFYTLILSSNISEDSVVVGNSYLGNTRKLKTIEKEDIIFCSRGAQFGRVTIFPEMGEDIITNIDNMHIKNNTAELWEKVFICQLLRYYRKIKYLYKVAIFGNGSFSFTKYHLIDLKFPNFSELKQKEIAKLYYNKVAKNLNLTLENYLEKEKCRNNDIGIFQLNMEIIELRELLDNLVHKIVMGEHIEIDFIKE